MAVTPCLFQAKDIEDREVLSFEYKFERDIDKEGQAVGITRGGLLKLKVKAINGGKPDIFNWMTERNLAHDGSITIKDTVNGKEMSKVSFEKGYCVDYAETWSDDEGHFEYFTLTCRHIDFGNIPYDNQWK